MTRIVRGAAVAVAIAVAPVVTQPLGRLAAPMALLLVLPPLAVGLEAFGWRDRLADRLRRVRSTQRRVVVAYGLWAATSAALSLDVAAVAAASVGPAAAESPRDRDWHLGAAILGANLGSLLFPFSNLTNLLLVSSAGIGFAAYVQAALVPQVLAVATGGVVLARRLRREPPTAAEPVPARTSAPMDLQPITTIAVVVLLAAVCASIAAVGVGLVDAPVQVPFALAAALGTGAAVAAGRRGIREVGASIPIAGVAVIAGAWLLAGPMAAAGGRVPVPDDGVAGIVCACLVGGLLSVAVNNLPAAAFGALWLGTASPVLVVAYLIGTNVTAIATAHGSVATMLARSVARRDGPVDSAAGYAMTAWRYAVPTTLVAVAVLVMVR